MKLTLNTPSLLDTSSQALFILVDAEQLKQIPATYKINDLDQIIATTQFKASLNEVLPLIGKITQQTNSSLIGLDQATELSPAK